MTRSLMLSLCLLAACAGGDSEEEDDDGGSSGLEDETGEPGDGLTVELDTTMGLVELRLSEKTPESTANFQRYCDEGFYDGGDGLGATIFHRVLVDFVVQGGIFTASGEAKETYDPIPLETNLGLSNVRGTLAMARTTVPDSATASFYINHVDNTFLDYESEDSPGYAVFGEVRAGMEVVDAIAEVAVDGNGWPDEDVLVSSCSRS